MIWDLGDCGMTWGLGDCGMIWNWGLWNDLNLGSLGLWCMNGHHVWKQVCDGLC